MKHELLRNITKYPGNNHLVQEIEYSKHARNSLCVPS